MKNRIVFLSALLSLFVSTIVVYSCEKDQVKPVRALTTIDALEMSRRNQQEARMCGELQEMKVIVDVEKPQDIDLDGEVGRAFVYNNNEFLFIELIAKDDYVMSNTYMHIAKDFNHIPLDHYKNPNIQVFEHKIQTDEGSKFRTFKIPLKDINANKYLITIAAEVRTNKERPGNERIAWVGGRQYGTKFIGRVFKYHQNVCLVNDKETTTSHE